MTIPASIRQISPAWLTEVLRESGTLHRTARIVSVTHQPIEGVVGLLGEIGRLHVAYDTDAVGAPASLIVKGPSLAPPNRAAAIATGCYEHEVRFYQEVAPRLEVRVPRCLAAEIDMGSGDFVLVLEDLVDVAVGDQLVGATLSQAGVAIDVMADLHAAWWDSDDLTEEGCLSWIPALDSAIAQARCPIIRTCWDPFVAAYGDRIGPRGVAVGDWMQQHCDEIYRKAAVGPVTIAHGDYRLDNLFFDRHDTQREDVFAVVDWQMPVAATGVVDLCYFIAGSLPVELRQAHEDELVNRYVDRLRWRGVEVDRGDVWDRYRVLTLANLAFAIVAGGGIDAGDERGRLLVDCYVDRFFAAALDHGVDLLN